MNDMFAKYGNIFLKFYENDPVIAEHEVETFPDVQKRVLDMVDHVLKKHKNENVILVTHMDPIKSMLAKVMNLLPETLFELIIEKCLSYHNQRTGWKVFSFSNKCNEY